MTMHGSENVKFFKLFTVYFSEISLILFLKLLKIYSVAQANFFPPFQILFQLLCLNKNI